MLVRPVSYSRSVCRKFPINKAKKVTNAAYTDTTLFTPFKAKDFRTIMSSYKAQKLAQILHTHEWSDCAFLVENEKIPAHKLILACNSPVFEAMFFGPFPTSELVPIADMSAPDFKVMLEHLYTGRTRPESIRQAWSLIYAGQKYFLADLVAICVDYITENLGVKDLLLSYEHARMYGQEKLARVCFQDVLVNAKEVFRLTDYHVKIDTLWDVLSEKDYANVDDDALTIYVLDWLEEECRMKELPVSDENVYEVASTNGLLKYLRNGNGNGNCNSKQVLDRKQPTLRYAYKISKKLRFNRPLTLSTLFSADKKCLVSGLSVLTQHRPSSAPSDKYFGGIDAKILENQQVLAETALRKREFRYDEAVSLHFRDVLLVTPRSLYQIVVSYYPENCNESEVLLNFYASTLTGTNNTNFEFFDEFDGSVLNGIASYPV